jgi:hypothetical protein
MSSTPQSFHRRRFRIRLRIACPPLKLVPRQPIPPAVTRPTVPVALATLGVLPTQVPVREGPPPGSRVSSSRAVETENKGVATPKANK